VQTSYFKTRYRNYSERLWIGVRTLRNTAQNSVAIDHNVQRRIDHWWPPRPRRNAFSSRFYVHVGLGLYFCWPTTVEYRAVQRQFCLIICFCRSPQSWHCVVTESSNYCRILAHYLFRISCGTFASVVDCTKRKGRKVHSVSTAGSIPQLVASLRSGNVVGRIDKVTLRRARLVLGWVTVFGGQTTAVFHQATQANSASYPQRDGKWVPAKMR